LTSTNENFGNADINNLLAQHYDQVVNKQSHIYTTPYEIAEFYLNQWISGQMTTYLDRIREFIEHIDNDLVVSRNFRDDSQNQFDNQHTQYQIVNNKCDYTNVPDDSDVRIPCDNLLDNADVIEADSVIIKNSINQKHEIHIRDGIDYIHEHYNAIITFHRAIRDRIEIIRQKLFGILNSAKTYHNNIIENQFPTRNYDEAFTWAITQSQSGHSILDEINNHIEMMATFSEISANYIADTLASTQTIGNSDILAEFQTYLDTMNDNVQSAKNIYNTITDNAISINNALQFECNKIKAQAIKYKR
jgi:hypothetical protein